MYSDLYLKDKKPKIYADLNHSSTLNSILEKRQFKLYDKENDISNLINLTSNDIAANIQDLVGHADIIYNTTPIYAHDGIFREVWKATEKLGKKIYFINLSGCFSSFSQMLIQRDNPLIKIGSTSTFPYACRIIDSDCILLGSKSEIPCAFVNSNTLEEDVAIVRNSFGRVKLVAHHNLLEMALGGVNFITHPLITLMNLNKIDEEESFYFYKNGITSSIAKLLDRAELERKNLASILKYRNFKDSLEQCRQFYNEKYQDWTAFSSESKVHQIILGPNSIKNRYLEEDIPYGLVPVWSLGQLLKVEMPIIKSLIDMASVIKNENYYLSPYNLINHADLADFILMKR